jgi:GDSL-like Lipase/Acylhydrolase family
LNQKAGLATKILIAVVSIVVTAALAEVVSRHLYPVQVAHFVDCHGNHAEILQNDHELEFTMKPNFCGKLQGSEFENSIQTNSSGFRDPKEFTKDKHGSIRVFGLGDSFAFGWGVEQQQTYLSLLEGELQNRMGASVSTFNLGVWGYGTLQEIGIFNRFREYQPDLVILEFYARDAYIEEWGNDLVDNYHFEQWYEARGKRKGRSQPASGHYTAEVSATKEFVAQNCNLCRIAALEVGPYFKGNFHPAGNDSLRKVAWQLTEHALQDFDRELQSMNIKALLLWIPPPGTIAARDYSVLDKLNSFGFQNIVIVSTLDALSSNPQRFYYSLDAHWRPPAHRVAAQLLVDTILSQRLVAKPDPASSN